MNGLELKKLREQKGITQKQLSDETGIPQSTISRIESTGEEIKKVDVDSVLKKYFFKENNGSFSLKDPGVTYRRKTIITTPPIPIYDIEFDSGVLKKLIEQDDKHFPIGQLSIPQVSGCDVIIRARGNNMADKINDGDLVGIKQIDKNEWFPMDEIYFIETKQAQVMKYIRKSDIDGKLKISSHNKAYSDDEIPFEAIVDLWSVKTVLPFSKIETLI